MATSLRKNKALASRLLLVTGYLFLLAIQLNSRYYTIANFFTYGENTTVTVQQVHETGTQPGQPGAYYHNTHRPAYLSLDKRFRFRHFIQPAFICSPPAVTYVDVERNQDRPSPVYRSSDLPCNSLRGPPAA